MSVIISTALRRLVAQRAGNRCEYCLFPEAVALHRHEPDHIVPLQHGGATDPDNLALPACDAIATKAPTWVPLIP